MLEYSDILKTRYEAVTQSDSDSLFYQNIHAYIDFIKTTPELLAIIEKSEKEYGTKFIDKNTSDYHERLSSFERFSLYASNYCLLEMRIYYPIEYYKNPPDEAGNQLDPVAILMLKGFDSATKMNLWGKSELKTLNKWYDGERKLYENALKQFHADFLTELGREKVKPTQQNTKLEITFDTEKSILKIGDKEVSIKIKNDKPNSHYVLEFIFEKGVKEQAFCTDILEEKFARERANNMSMYRACQDINKKVSEQAKISNFLIIKSGKTGYTQVNPEYL